MTHLSVRFMISVFICLLVGPYGPLGWTNIGWLAERSVLKFLKGGGLSDSLTRSV